MSSSPSSSFISLVTGANRGIGLALVRELLAGTHKSTSTIPTDTIVIATARTPEKATDLQALQKEFGSDRLDIAQLDVEDSKSITALAQYVTDKYNRLDLLINNAGFGVLGGPTSFQGPADEQTFAINTFGPVKITNALLPLLRATLKYKTETLGKEDSSKPYVRSIYISSTLGSVGNLPTHVFATYSASKAALNLYVRAYAKEVPEIAFASVHPGWVDTDMGRNGGTPPLKPLESAQGILEQVGALTLADAGNKFVDYAGTTLTW